VREKARSADERVEPFKLAHEVGLAALEGHDFRGVRSALRRERSIAVEQQRVITEVKRKLRSRNSAKKRSPIAFLIEHTRRSSKT
jgi:hypothetical protein